MFTSKCLRYVRNANRRRIGRRFGQRCNRKEYLCAGNRLRRAIATQLQVRDGSNCAFSRFNPLYSGRIRWNVSQFVRDPGTGSYKRRRRPAADRHEFQDESLRSLDLVYQLNERCLEVLSQFVASDEDRSTRSASAVDRDLWRNPDYTARKRAARLPFVVVDIHFTDIGRWQRIREPIDRGPADATDQAFFPREIGERRDRAPLARFAGTVARMLLAAQSGDEDRLAEAKLQAKVLLTGELLAKSS